MDGKTEEYHGLYSISKDMILIIKKLGDRPNINVPLCSIKKFTVEQNKRLKQANKHVREVYK